MITYVEILRDKLNKLLSGEQIIPSEEIFKISKELDQLTINHIIEQTGNELRREA